MAKTKEKATEDVKVKTFRPEDLATELEISGKQIRAFLRSEYPRKADEKNTSWVLTEAMANAVRERFSKSEESDEEE